MLLCAGFTGTQTRSEAPQTQTQTNAPAPERGLDAFVSYSRRDQHFDQNCFDPDYDSLPLEFFRPIVEDVFRQPRHAADDLAFVGL